MFRKHPDVSEPVGWSCPWEIPPTGQLLDVPGSADHPAADLIFCNKLSSTLNININGNRLRLGNKIWLSRVKLLIIRLLVT